MIGLTLDGSSRFAVASRNGVTTFATDGSAPNPFEGALVAIAGCAGVYAAKACQAAGVSSAGIQVDLKPTVAGGGLEVRKVAIKLQFPEDFPADLIPQVLASVDACPVKEMIRNGGAIEFSIVAVEAVSALP